MREAKVQPNTARNEDVFSAESISLQEFDTHAIPNSIRSRQFDKYIDKHFFN
jgi:hypothetical protein